MNPALSAAAIVKSVRSKLSAIALVGALISAIGGSVFAGQVHPVCVTKHHDCDTATTMASCCCGDQGASNPSGPTESRVQVGADLSAVSEASATALVHDMHRAMVQPHTSPPRDGPLDFPILFASLLI
jgi:hypothetical protein